MLYSFKLIFVLQLYSDAMSKSTDNVVTKQNIKTMFNSVDTIYEFHRSSFLPSLRTAIISTHDIFEAFANLVLNIPRKVIISG